MKHTLIRSLPALGLAVLLAGVPAAPAGAAGTPGARPEGATLPAPAQEVPAPGAVLLLNETPHLWVVDEQRTAHFVADPEALDGRPVDWGDVRAVTVSELRRTPRAEPWLTADLVDIDGAIYLPQFSPAGGAPTLLHIRSADDLSLLGVGADNYGRVVLPRATWEERYGFSTDKLPVADFATYADDLPAPEPLTPVAPATTDGSIG